MGAAKRVISFPEGSNAARKAHLYVEGYRKSPESQDEFLLGDGEVAEAIAREPWE